MTIETPVLEKKKTTSKELKEPPKYKVLVLNDDVTPMEFVVAMLVTIFNLAQEHALNLTLEIHNNGSAVAGIYSHEVAEQKVSDAIKMARGNGYPLNVKSEVA